MHNLVDDPIFIYFFLIISFHMDSMWNLAFSSSFHGFDMESTWNSRNYSILSTYGHSIIQCGIWSFLHLYISFSSAMYVPNMWVINIDLFSSERHHSDVHPKVLAMLATRQFAFFPTSNGNVED